MKSINKSLLNVAAVLMIALVTFAFKGAEKQYAVEVAKTNVKWTGEKVTGSHWGTVKVKEGTLSMDGDQLSGTFILDMTSIDVKDLEGEYKGKLEGHLKSEDFFGVEKYETSKFEIIKAYRQGKEKNEYKVVGKLTIKGITKEIKFPATIDADKNVLTAKATVKVDRTEFDIRYGSGSFFDNLGDKTIYDEFTLDIDLSAKAVAG
ncbi:YceI family protein [Persicobacter diffluens]|uniref:Lipid-binding protein n=1 Tax=Persicobacter diffluens TaxID=981 RepID=A0AAN5AMV1_9BACT|nr:lipid-binding protein [Persicobacter diffluens]